MITMVFLKALCDLGIYYTFAGFLAVLFGAASSLLLAALLIQALCFTATYALRQSRLRFLPLGLLLLCWILPGAGPAEYVAFVPPAAYLTWLTAKERFFPEWSHQADIFSRFWKLFFPFLILALIFGGAETITAITIPAGAITLLCLVLLTRNLRHDPEVYCQKRCQLLNLSAVAGAGVCAFLLSTPTFLQWCLTVLRTIYTYLLAPVLMLLVYAAVGILSVVVWLISWIKLGFKAPENSVTLNFQSAAETLGVEEAISDTPGYLEKIGIALGIIIGALLLWALFRYLSRRNGAAAPAKVGSERREPLFPHTGAAENPQENSHIQRVRAQYRRFLKLYYKAGLTRSPGDTSQDIARYSRETMGDEVSALRELYISARYNGEATREDAAQARELCTRIKRRQPK